LSVGRWSVVPPCSWSGVGVTYRESASRRVSHSSMLAAPPSAKAAALAAISGHDDDDTRPLRLLDDEEECPALWLGLSLPGGSMLVTRTYWGVSSIECVLTGK
jgi:hypothetical protein